jgi:hypothetical protein
MPRWYLLFFNSRNQPYLILHTENIEMVIETKVRFGFYTMLMISLHTLDSGAGIMSALRNHEGSSHYRQTGEL